MLICDLPSGKRLHFANWKIPFLMGKTYKKTMEDHHAINGSINYFYHHVQ